MPRLEGTALAADAARWVSANRATFESIYCFLKGMQEAGRKGRVRDRVAIHCIDNALKVGEGFTLTNGLWAGIARYLVRYDPSLEGNPIVLAKSAIDDVELPKVRWMECGR